ncbi:hypothetical protein [Actinomadura madurae]|uniref:hypothetical protein n=1 Tax=Actinomadura madurae TaxID=1993 RepID=UPI0020D25B56|nr:hypothetical protein [Actinomadura madurae]MCP9949712.1 hypothetical protein [Actinomadura madurae]MCP9978949.1 hypothetical protein [Actinomadura madurae]MCQ0015134.1 hypothetical protein [Actinomadura madurae]
MLAQVERVEVEAEIEVEIGQVLLEEVVDEPVQVQHGPAGRVGAAPPHQRRHDLALGVPAHRQLDRLVAGAEHIRRHVHISSHMPRTDPPWSRVKDIDRTSD